MQMIVIINSRNKYASQWWWCADGDAGGSSGGAEARWSGGFLKISKLGFVKCKTNANQSRLGLNFANQ